MPLLSSRGVTVSAPSTQPGCGRRRSAAGTAAAPPAERSFVIERPTNPCSPSTHLRTGVCRPARRVVRSYPERAFDPLGLGPRGYRPGVPGLEDTDRPAAHGADLHREGARADAPTDPDLETARGPRDHRAAHARARLSAVRAGDRRGGGPDVAVHGPCP